MEDPSCRSPLYLFEGVNAGVAVRIPNRTCILQKWEDNGFVGVSLHLFVLEPQVPSEGAQGLVGLADYAVDMRIPLQVSRDGDTEVLGLWDTWMLVSMSGIIAVGEELAQCTINWLSQPGF